MNIKHLVIPGGGLIFFSLYGIFKKLNQNNVWSINTLKSIYSTSCGSIVGLFILLNIEWDILDKYIIEKDWSKEFIIDDNILFNWLDNKGIINIDWLDKIIKPLFLYKGWDINITLKELYDKTNIKFNIMITKLSKEYV